MKHAPPHAGRPVPVVPDVPSVSSALTQAEAWVSLMQRLQASQACLQAVLPDIPPSLRPHLRAGPWDHEGWTLLVANNAISSKMRQLLPRLQDVLAQKGCKVNAIRLRVQIPTE